MNLRFWMWFDEAGYLMFRDMNKQALNRCNTKAHCANKLKLHVVNLLEKKHGINEKIFKVSRLVAR